MSVTLIIGPASSHVRREIRPEDRPRTPLRSRP
jgi:hypothetical protein